MTMLSSLFSAMNKNRDSSTSNSFEEKMKVSLVFLERIAWTLLIIFSGCSGLPDKPKIVPSQAATTAADLNQALATMATQASSSPSSYQIGPEDLLEITIFNIPESEARITPRLTKVRVNQQGRVMLPLLGELPVQGLSVTALEEVLRARYDQYLHDPQIGVLVTEYRQRVSVVGAVLKPGPVELTGPKTLIDVLALAGGLTEKAGSQVHIYRNGPEGRQSYVIDLFFLTRGNRSANPESAALISMPVQVGDIINVPQAGMVFVDGAVKTPGSFPIPRRNTLTQALTLAGGVDYELADYSGTVIFRRKQTGEVETIPVNLNEVLAGNTADPQLEPDDSIVVPVSSVKYFVKRYVGVMISGNFSPFMFR